jgi:hypothetical protein
MNEVSPRRPPGGLGGGGVGWTSSTSVGAREGDGLAARAITLASRTVPHCRHASAVSGDSSEHFGQVFTLAS